MENRPVDVSESHFKDLLNYWNSDSHKDEMEKIQSTQESEDDSQSVDAFVSVMGVEHPGRVRLYGRGVTKTVLIRKMEDFVPSLNATGDRMQQKIEEMEERMQQRMLEKFNAHKDAWEQKITLNVVSQLRRINPGLQIDHNMLNFSTRSPGEASSAQQNAIQLINRLSTDSNNRGGENGEREDVDIEYLHLTQEDFWIIAGILDVLRIFYANS
ncbi:uncharacterized protein LOC107820978 isoform X1 [Nicotiana tabacum]|uniref:Uncharacterized protein isoform X1 n=5 Tax=Nicotiana tabacum TaxID=4097 RepID=A0A1S4CPD6_TOBAC|nr:PREDICTED: uncharacterized protein LOC107820978 isoform X1 [Nicotiana tabacum]XP_016502833.1 PREDICTED: uncharacterized protein LOC107820978 isoform X1 [Nicotiana tabacum]XP_016502834.1 PREDICTED: uncharacterized protein LOC107820978 isoform X1 [Nicotiana tabacum]